MQRFVIEVSAHPVRDQSAQIVDPIAEQCARQAGKFARLVERISERSADYVVLMAVEGLHHDTVERLQGRDGAPVPADDQPLSSGDPVK